MSQSAGCVEFRRWSWDVRDLFKFCCQMRSFVVVCSFVGSAGGGGIAC